MAESSNADIMVSGLKNENILKTIGYFWSDALNCFIFGHGPMTPTLLDVAMITGLDIVHRCYTFFDALALPIPHNLRFSSTTDGFETWWSMWKTHVFRRALGPQLKQLDAAHDISADQINETSSGVVEEVPMPSTAPGPSNSPRVTDHSSDQHTAKPIVTTSASLPFLGEGCDPSSLLTFDPDSIEPAAPKIGEEPNLGAVDVFKSRVQSARQRITLRRAQLPLRADIAEKCQRLNEKKAALDAKTATSTHSARLETLRKELEDLERRARETKQLIQDEESFIARSQEEAQGLTADLKTDLAEIRALSSQLVMGRDEDDEVEIAEVDRIRADALHALNAFLQ
ncbi:hypothetical protein QYE76_007200 [Lolium multiflorum]|uniref:Aminotransferase-like plant mobile domain-containing protein n=1 Tax=Lolium multiflorum TaxID=4521 RepID=A0AAD8RW45_LOLMU|nr:hypothetical protein QYE76_007200 [Lolium multiflorum]